MLNIGFTGTRHGMTRIQSRAVRMLLAEYRKLGAAIFHHGDCLGADIESARLARLAGYRVVIHPPLDPKYRAFDKPALGDSIRSPKPFLKRNRDIVNETAVLIAAPRGEQVQRSGTWSTVRVAIAFGRYITIVYPDGRTTVEPI